MGWRQVVDDARRLHFVIGLVAAVAVAVWAGTYWGWWAYMWDIALPVRIVGVVALSASAFVLWYALLFSSHYYLGVPRRNPLIGPRLLSDVQHPNLRLALHGGWNEQEHSYVIGVENQGDTDTFAVETSWMQGAPNYPPLPAMMRWRGVDAEKREIVKGHTHQLEVCRYEREAPKAGDRALQHLWLLAPGAEIDLLSGPNRYVELRWSFKVTSVTTGKSDRFSMNLIVLSADLFRTCAALGRDDSSVYSM